MKYTYLTFLILILNVVGLSAQNDVFFSQNYANNSTLNPAFVGSSDQLLFTGGIREQWVGIEGSPNYSMANVSMPFSLFNLNQGVGFSVVRDAFGFNKNISFSGSYAAHFNISGAGTLGFGLGFGFVNNSFSPSFIADNDGDSKIPIDNTFSNAVFDLSFGVYYKTDNMYFGLSGANLLAHDLSGVQNSSKASRLFHLSAGYEVGISDTKWVAMPSVFVSTNVTNASMNLTCNFEYNKILWLGDNYKVADAISAIAGVVLLKDIRIGYAYDFNTSKLRKANGGSHELMVRYQFDLRKEKNPSSYRSVRYL